MAGAHCPHNTTQGRRQIKSFRAHKQRSDSLSYAAKQTIETARTKSKQQQQQQPAVNQNEFLTIFTEPSEFNYRSKSAGSMKASQAQTI